MIVTPMAVISAAILDRRLRATVVFCGAARGLFSEGYFRCALRYNNDPTDRDLSYGFRCARTIAL